MQLRNLLVAPVVAAILLSGAIAQSHAETAPVSSQLDARVKDAPDAGWAPLKAGASISPGALIEYRITHKNNTDDALPGFVVSGPIPGGTHYVGGSAQTAFPGALEVLVKGEDWQPHPGMKTVVDENGKDARVPAEPKDYTAVRWKLDGALKAGASVEHAYRVKVRQ